jgi:hypothetical protein
LPGSLPQTHRLADHSPLIRSTATHPFGSVHQVVVR